MLMSLRQSDTKGGVIVMLVNGMLLVKNAGGYVLQSEQGIRAQVSNMSQAIRIITALTMNEKISKGTLIRLYERTNELIKNSNEYLEDLEAEADFCRYQKEEDVCTDEILYETGYRNALTFILQEIEDGIRYLPR
jgi:hypothetical protein